MTLNLSNLITYEQMIKKSSQRTGVFKQDALYFSFEEKRIYLGNTYFLGFVNFDFHLEENEIVKDFYIDKDKLFFMLKDFEDLTSINMILEDSKGRDKYNSYIPVFKNGKNEYIIKSLIQSKTENLPKDDDYETIKIGIDDILKIKEIIKFVDINSQINSAFIEDGYDNPEEKWIYAISASSYYHAKTNLTSKFVIHRLFAEILSVIPSTQEEITLLYNEGYNAIEIENKITIYFSNKDTNYYFPTKDEYVNEVGVPLVRFNNSISLNFKELQNALKFFDPFYSLESRPLTATVLNDSELEFKSMSDEDKITKIIPISEVDLSLVGVEVKFNSLNLKKALETYKNDTINFYLNENERGLGVALNPNEKKIYIRALKD